LNKNSQTLDKAILTGIYSLLRNLKGFNDEDVLRMPSPRFWMLLEMLGDEMKEREKEAKKANRKGRGKHGR